MFSAISVAFEAADAAAAVAAAEAEAADAVTSLVVEAGFSTSFDSSLHPKDSSSSKIQPFVVYIARY